MNSMAELQSNSERLNQFKFDDAISRGEIQLVILFGAPRSGTQMYRDMICEHKEIVTWPFNEMTYMWRYGNRDYPTDEIPVDLLTEKTARYIRDSFIKLGKKSNCRLVVDKTCHNCLRPDFVAAVLPEATYIYLVRHGMDVVPSTVKRSESPPPYREYLRIMSIPPADIPYYFTRALWNHGGLFRPGKRSVRVWGPKFKGMKELAETKPIHEVSAHQWVRHMELTDQFLNGKNFKSSLLRVRYEEITSEPRRELERVFKYLNVEPTDSLIEKWVGEVRHHEPGSRASKLGEHEEAVRAIVSDKNAEHGYR